jgi:hypothetical protein
MRPQVLGLRCMPIWARAACTRNSPSSGFSCSFLTAAMARMSTLRTLPGRPRVDADCDYGCASARSSARST